jgi:hypothetical protein
MFTQQDAIKARVDDTAICRPNSRACGTERERERERESEDASESFEILTVSQRKRNVILRYFHP